MTTTTAPRFSLYWFASPQTFYPLAGRLIPWFIALATLFTAIGLYIAFVAAPIDATQGESYRIIFIHVPAAWMSMFLYVVMAFWAAIGLVAFTFIASAIFLNFWGLQGEARSNAIKGWQSNMAIVGGLLVSAAHAT